MDVVGTLLRESDNADAFAAGGGGWTQIATANSTSGTAIDFTNIPTTYQDLLVLLEGVSGTSTGPITIALSHNGSSYSTAINLLASTGAANAYYGSALISRYQGNSGTIFGALAAVASPPSANGGLAASAIPWRVATIQAIRIGMGVGTFDAGTITLYGK